MERLAPDRVLSWTFETLAAEVARQCIAEWSQWRDYDHGDRRAACERMAIIVELGRDQTALAIRRSTGWTAPRGRSIGVRTRDMADVLEGATRDNPEDLAELTTQRIRHEVMRPYWQFAAAREDESNG